jgi:hypothetical protein
MAGMGTERAVFHFAQSIAALLWRPHPEEHRDAMRLEGWMQHWSIN